MAVFNPGKGPLLPYATQNQLTTTKKARDYYPGQVYVTDLSGGADFVYTSFDGQYRNYAGTVIGGSGGGTPGAPAALSGITTVWVYDASIPNEMMNSQSGVTADFANAMANYVQEVHGLTLTIVNKSVSGNTLEQIAARWEAEKASINGRADILVLSAPVGNNITPNVPWSGTSPAFRTDLLAKFQAFADSVKANGNVGMFGPSTFRNYTNARTDEAAGSKPFNDYLLPVIASQVPTMMYNGKAYMDSYYDLTRNTVYADYVSVSATADDGNSGSTMLRDMVHPRDPSGYAAGVRNWVLDVVASRIKGLTPPTVTRVATPTLATAKAPAQAMFYITNSTVKGYGQVIRGAYGIPNTLPTADELFNRRAWLPNSLRLTIPGPSGRGANTGSATGNTSGGLLNDVAKATFYSTTSTTFAPLFTLDGFLPNQQVVLDMMSCRINVAGTIYGAQFSFDGGTTVQAQEANSLVISGSEPVPYQLTTTANASGQVALSWRMKPGVGAAAGHWNAAIVTPM